MQARTPRERMHVELHLMQAELRVRDELLGTGFLTGIPLSHGARPITMGIPVSRGAVSYLEAASPENRIDLELKLTGWLRARDDNEDANRFMSDPLPASQSSRALARPTRRFSGSKSRAGGVGALRRVVTSAATVLARIGRPRSSWRA
jgi:hypothetical protein